MLAQYPSQSKCSDLDTPLTVSIAQYPSHTLSVHVRVRVVCAEQLGEWNAVPAGTMQLYQIKTNPFRTHCMVITT